jgi:hypothetical protein
VSPRSIPTWAWTLLLGVLLGALGAFALRPSCPPGDDASPPAPYDAQAAEECATLHELAVQVLEQEAELEALDTLTPDERTREISRLLEERLR